MSFRVGQKVVCICDDVPKFFGDEQVPNKGAVYTVRAVFDGITDRLGVYLYEINNAHMIERWGGDTEPGFSAHIFRPVVERKTDISIFQRMLIPSKQGIEA